jgi:hypothetical protein
LSASPETDLDTAEEPELSLRAARALRIVLWSVVAVMAAGWIFLSRSLAPAVPTPPPAAAKPAPAPPAAEATTRPTAGTTEALRAASWRHGPASVAAAQDEAQQWYDRWVGATWANHPSAADARKHLDEAAAKIGLTPAQMGFDMDIAPGRDPAR